MKSAVIRDTIVRNLKNEKDFEGLRTLKINGVTSAAVDITLYDEELKRWQSFRIAIIPHAYHEDVKEDEGHRYVKDVMDVVGITLCHEDAKGGACS